MKILCNDEVPDQPGLNEHRETDWRGLAFGLLLTPVFYVLLRRLFGRRRADAAEKEVAKAPAE